MPFLVREPANDWEWLALAQHFGMATRLLDWTENALVAAYFATRVSWNGADRVLYILDETRLAEADPLANPFSFTDVRVYRPNHIAARITSQSGVFTMHGRPGTPFVGDFLERWVIRDECVIDLDMTIDSYGVTEASIFQDLGGLARHINAKWSIDTALDGS